MKKRLDITDGASDFADRFLAGASITELADHMKCARDLMRKVIRATLGYKVVTEVNRQRKINNFGDKLKQFKNGNRVGRLFTGEVLRGASARQWVPVGTKRLKVKRQSSATGKPIVRRYWVIKVDDVVGSRTGNWESLAAYNYKQYIGPIPEGHCVIHKNGDSMNDSPSNLMLIQKNNILQHMMDHKREVIHNRKWRKNLIVANKRRGKDLRAMNRIREIIPVPSCVNQSMEAGWWDNREDEEEDE